MSRREVALSIWNHTRTGSSVAAAVVATAGLWWFDLHSMGLRLNNLYLVAGILALAVLVYRSTLCIGLAALVHRAPFRAMWELSVVHRHGKFWRHHRPTRQWIGAQLETARATA